MSMNLGDRLRQRIDRDVAEEALRVQHEEQQKAAEARRKQDLLRHFLDDTKTQFTNRILADEPISAVKIGYRNHAEIRNILGGDFLNAAAAGLIPAPGEYTALWGEFVHWCEANGLECVVEYQHDGVGIESWHLLSVRPTASVV
ncbi:hypothetical protein [Burkholderia cenocepacia]|uniref:hypothetical protein n=1 Tax=Burkholderia cenocepacia TaxID=95486 RepID=UPI0007618BA3|nr:hypothetical protein [Burkholderia cenocepacia]KWU23408.1 hypothetical protein AS149_37095 [Burkholderia cenocepacia]